MEAALTWDHIMDGDPIDKDVADRAFMALTIGWPMNEWFIKNRVILVPVMVNAISAWKHASIVGTPKIKAYDVYAEVACTMALLLGGLTAVKVYGPKIRELTQAMCLTDEQRDEGRK